MFFHATRRKHKIRGDPFVRNNQGLTPLTLAAKLGRKEMFHEILEYQSMVRKHLIKEKRSPNKGYVTRDDSQRRFLAQHSVTTLLGRCFELLQHCSNIATLRCAKNSRCAPARVTSP